MSFEQEAGPSSQQPMSFEQEPGPSSQQPMSFEQEPGPSSQQPMSSDVRPDNPPPISFVLVQPNGQSNRPSVSYIRLQNCHPEVEPYVPWYGMKTRSRAARLPIIYAVRSLAPEASSLRPQPPPGAPNGGHEIIPISYAYLFACDVCDIPFGSESSLVEHKKTHKNVGKNRAAAQQQKPKKPNPKYCNICCKHFQSVAARSRHLKWIHGNLESPVNVSELFKSKSFDQQMHEAFVQFEIDLPPKFKDEFFCKNNCARVHEEIAGRRGHGDGETTDDQDQEPSTSSSVPRATRRYKHRTRATTEPSCAGTKRFKCQHYKCRFASRDLKAISEHARVHDPKTTTRRRPMFKPKPLTCDHHPDCKFSSRSQKTFEEHLHDFHLPPVTFADYEYAEIKTEDEIKTEKDEIKTEQDDDIEPEYMDFQ